MGLDAMTAHFMFEGTFKETHIDAKRLVDEWGVTYGITAEDKAPIEGPIKSLEDARRYIPPDPNAPYRLGGLPEYVERFKGRRAVVWCQRAEWMWAACLRRLDNLLVDFLDNPALARAVIEISIEFAVVLARRAVRAGADVVMIGDDYAYRSGPMMSPAVYREFLLPGLRRVVQVVKEEGALCVKHSDGNLWPILDMILSTGVDAINPMEPVAGMDIGEVKRKHGDRVCLIGNIDCGELLSRGSVDDVVRSVKQTILAAAPGGGYIMMSSNTIHSSVKPDNYRAMIEATHRYGEYPLDLEALEA
jgi:uroporphyrinogen decarboxylase